MNPWNVAFLVGFVVYVAIRGHYEKRLKGVETVRSERDGVEVAALAFVAVGCMLLPLLYVFTPLLAFADYDLPRVAPWCGIGVMAAGLLLFQRSHADLDRNWSFTLEVRRDHRLVSHGAYRLIRHPMYAAILLIGVAQGLLLANWLAGWSALVSFGVLYALRVRREEALMLATFGDAYRAYMARTGRLFPRLGPEK